MNPREAISAQSAEQRKNTRRLPMELLLFLIMLFCVHCSFGCGEDIKGIRDIAVLGLYPRRRRGVFLIRQI